MSLVEIKWNIFRDNVDDINKGITFLHTLPLNLPMREGSVKKGDVVHWLLTTHFYRLAVRAGERRKKMDMEELCNACARGQMDAVKHLLSVGVNVNGLNQYNRTPIQVGRYYCF